MPSSSSYTTTGAPRRGTRSNASSSSRSKGREAAKGGWRSAKRGSGRTSKMAISCPSTSARRTSSGFAQATCSRTSGLTSSETPSSGRVAPITAGLAPRCSGNRKPDEGKLLSHRHGRRGQLGYAFVGDPRRRALDSYGRPCQTLPVEDRGAYGPHADVALLVVQRVPLRADLLESLS